MIVLDASVLIAYWGEDDPHADAAFDILDTDEELLLHPVTLTETLVWPIRAEAGEEALEDIAQIGVERHEPRRDEPLRAARLRAQTRLGLPDCFVLAAAIEHEATLATFDKRLADTARAHGVTVVGV
ncbi:hypothetical protein GCM10025768_17810 [Microbacterium pseudoresistens]|uniref:Ribonuclease VapC n=1 Tax=Microbacterium pseudoresistens TaxID=640634 RepID=A0A7Y9EX11_9MICO|nr:putative nucleic acid-binding protein [Microbacterium pseudoresistens]